jgi:hypothetical protein
VEVVEDIRLTHLPTLVQGELVEVLVVVLDLKVMETQEQLTPVVVVVVLLETQQFPEEEQVVRE